MKIKIKRAYEPARADDGFRVLVDRLWPRGVSKEKLAADLWLKEIGPSNDLRKWFNHDPAKFNEFKKKYLAELKDNPAVNEIKQVKKPVVTLVYSAHDEQHNQAVVLKDFLKEL